MVTAPRLYGITDSQLMPGRVLLEKVEAALQGGCGWLQYRDKSCDWERRDREARQLLELCQQYDAKLIINDDIELAANVGAHGVHLGQEDESAAKARARLGADAIIGVTCHADLALARAAQEAGVDYVAFGRFFVSSTKPGASAAPLDVLTEAKKAFKLPVVAIGGINLDNAAQVIASGADTLAVCGGLFAQADPTSQAQAFLRLR